MAARLHMVKDRCGCVGRSHFSLKGTGPTLPVYDMRNWASVIGNECAGYAEGHSLKWIACISTEGIQEKDTGKI